MQVSNVIVFNIEISIWPTNGSIDIACLQYALINDKQTSLDNGIFIAVISSKKLKTFPIFSHLTWTTD